MQPKVYDELYLNCQQGNVMAVELSYITIICCLICCLNNQPCTLIFVEFAILPLLCSNGSLFQVILNDPFLGKCNKGNSITVPFRDEFFENARLFIFETYCHTHRCIDIRWVLLIFYSLIVTDEILLQRLNGNSNNHSIATH